MRKFVLTAAMGLLVAGCGNYVGPGRNPTPTPTQAAAVTATEQDHIVSLHAGQKLEVALHAPNGMSNWTNVKSSDATVLAPTVDTKATARVGVTLAAFQALRSGSAEVTATAAPKCPPNSACPMFVAFYSLKVTVTQ